MDFMGKVVVVTGAFSGIGRCVADYLANLNAIVALVDRNEDRVDSVQQSFARLSKPENYLTIVADITNRNDRTKIIEKTLGKFGKIDVLVNNAGIAKIGKNVESTEMSDFDLMFDTNVKSVFALTQLAIPHLIKSKGNIVNTSSVLGIRAVAGKSCYGMSKAALNHFTRCLALELAPLGVRVNAINPAVVETDFQRNMGMEEETYQKFLKAAVQLHPLGRVGKVDDVAKSIAFLASSEMSSFITGTILTVDGGQAIMCPR